MTIDKVLVTGKMVSSPGEILGDEDMLVIRAFGNHEINVNFSACTNKARSLKIPYIQLGVIDISNRTVPDYVNRNADKQCLLMKQAFEENLSDGNVLAFFNYYDNETPQNAQRKINFFYSYMEDKFKDIQPLVWVSDSNKAAYGENLDIALTGKKLILTYDIPANKTSLNPPIYGSDYGAQAVFYAYGSQILSRWSASAVNDLLGIKGTEKAIGTGVVIPPVDPEGPTNPPVTVTDAETKAAIIGTYNILKRVFGE